VIRDETALPKPPERPDDQSCCGRGCCPCIFDYYYDALDRWKETVRASGADPEAMMARRSAPTAASFCGARKRS
jgi:hypothetical protein